MGWLSTRGRILEPSASRVAFLLVGGAAFVVTEFGRFVVRPWVRGFGVNDFGLTDTIGNWGGILVQIFLGCAVLNPNRQQSYRLAAFFSFGYVLYEFAQPFLPKGVFDWMDIAGTGIGYLISLPILAAIWRRVERPSSEIPEPTVEEQTRTGRGIGARSVGDGRDGSTMGECE